MGSNIGDSNATLQKAIRRLAEFSGEPIVASSLWQTAPVDCPQGSGAFFNAVVALMPRREETPETLLAKLHSIEAEFGRERTVVRNAPRTLDLDLIAFGRAIRSDARLTLPHPRAHERAFVLGPLSEIAPDYLLPGQTKTVRELLASLV